MFRFILCAAAALLTLGMATLSAAADDRETCAEGFRRDESIAACSRLLKRNPKDVGIYKLRADHYWLKKDYDGAIADYDEALRLAPKDAEVYIGRAQVYRSKGDYDGAIALLDKAITLAPKNAVAYINRSQVCEHGKHDFDRAIADYDQVVRLDPRPGNYMERGRLHGRKGDYDRAIADYDQALRLDPENGTAYDMRGNIYRRKGDYDRAIADFDQAIRIYPSSAGNYVDRGETYSLKRDYDRAVADADQAIKLLDPDISRSPDSSPYYEPRGRAHALKHDYDRAIADFDQAIRLFPKAWWYYNHRGEAYVDKGDYAAAIVDFDQALNLDPSFAEARQNRGRAQAALAARQTPAQPAAPAPSPSPLPQLPVLPPPAPPPQAVPLPPPASPAVTAERRVALIIGNSKYAAAPLLRNPRRDADAVAEALRQDGFQTVMLRSDLGRDALRDALRTFRAAADNADWALIYYAGHGLQIGKTNYLIPVDAKLADARDMQAETIAYSELETAIGGARVLRIIILDACRNDPFEAQMARANSSRALGRGLSPPPEPDAGMLVVYSAKDGQVAEDGDGANSPFAAALVAQLKVPGREVRRVFDYVREEVMNATGKRQQPFTYGSLPGSKDYYFVAGK